jgi:hypothetical protein
MVLKQICCRFWRRVGKLFTTISMIDGIKANLALHHYYNWNSGGGRAPLFGQTV